MTIGKPHPPFRHLMRSMHFQFAPTSKPLNHVSFGTHPNPVREAHYAFQTAAIGRPDTFVSFITFLLLAKSRAVTSPLLGVNHDKVVFVLNATTGVNNVLRNIDFEDEDVVVTFSTTYPAYIKTIGAVSKILPVKCKKIELVYPVKDEVILRSFTEKVRGLRAGRKRVRLAMFDTISSFPEARLLDGDLVGICKELYILI